LRKSKDPEDMKFNPRGLFLCMGVNTNIPVGFHQVCPYGKLSGTFFRTGSQRCGGLATYDRWCFVNEFVILEGCHHEEGIVHPAGEVALQDGIADVPALNR
jgi:hypothetical protein